MKSIKLTGFKGGGCLMVVLLCLLGIVVASLAALYIGIEPSIRRPITIGNELMIFKVVVLILSLISIVVFTHKQLLLKRDGGQDKSPASE